MNGVKHAVFAAIVALYVLVIAQNWAHFTAVLMTTAWVRHGGRLSAPIW